MFLLHWVTRRRIANIALTLLLAGTLLLLWRPDAAALYNQQSAQKNTTSTNHDRSEIARRRACELDRSYLPRLVAQTQQNGRCGFTEEDQLNEITSTIVMGRLREETKRIEWLDELRGIHERHIYIVDDANSSHLHLARNHGREAAVYLTYIVENYDKLNNVTFFWHNDRTVWHNNMMLNHDSVETINSMNRRNILTQGYVPSRCDQWPGCPSWIKFNPSSAEHKLDPHRLEEMFKPELFERLFPNDTQFPPFFAGTCCSQFAVSRDTIRSRPLSDYKVLLDWILEYDNDDHSGRMMEYVWPYVFLRQGSFCPSMYDCYCKTYDLCIDDPRDIESLEKWNALRTRREEVQWQVNFVKSGIDSKIAEMQTANMTREEMKTQLELQRPEYERLKEELQRLTDHTWEERQDILRRWRLDPAPMEW